MTLLRFAEAVFDSHRTHHPLDHYSAILSLHGLARLATTAAADERLMAKATSLLMPFVRGEQEVRSRNFQNYRCGGNGTAYLLWQGHLPAAHDVVADFARELMDDAPRSAEGIFCKPVAPHAGGIWIDVAFAVTPFLLFAGLHHQQDAWVVEACEQSLKMAAAFRNPANGLLHQSRDFRGPGLLSEDHWSRGNGWGILALAELANYLPVDHRCRPEVEAAFVDLLQACLRVQNAEGLWHQELTVTESYVETSGSGLILYALGVALEKGLVSADHRADLERGLRAYRGYITPAGDIFHTCRGCLCPGEGRIIDYMARAPVRNDSHAFGPVVLAFGQAVRLGIEELA